MYCFAKILLASFSVCALASQSEGLVRGAISGKAEETVKQLLELAGKTKDEANVKDIKQQTDMNFHAAEEVLSEVEAWATSGSKPDKPKIKTIQELVKTLFPILMSTRDTAQDQVTQMLNEIGTCNKHMIDRFSEIEAREAVIVKEERRNHTECRESEKEVSLAASFLQQGMTRSELGSQRKCTDLHKYLKNTVHDAPEMPDPSDDAAMVSYFMSMSEHWCPEADTCRDKKEKCDNEKEKLEQKKKECDKLQRVFELGFCLWRIKLVDTCIAHTDCYKMAKKLYEEHKIETEKLVKKWKTEYAALEKIMCYVGVWLKDDNADTVDKGQVEVCKKLDPDTSKMEIDFGKIPAAATCSLEAVAKHPGTPEFKSQEYADFLDLVVEVTPCFGREAQ